MAYISERDKILDEYGFDENDYRQMKDWYAKLSKDQIADLDSGETARVLRAHGYPEEDWGWEWGANDLRHSYNFYKAMKGLEDREAAKARAIRKEQAELNALHQLADSLQ